MTTASIRPAAGLASAIDRILGSALAEGRVAGAVALVAKGGELVYARATGFADLEHQTRMREDTIFLAASLTKPIVTAAFLSLVGEGAMGLDDPVTDYLPAFKPEFAGQAPAISLGQLLTHTSGLSYGFLQPDDGPYVRLGVSNGVDQPGLRLDEALARIVEAGLSFPPLDRGGSIPSAWMCWARRWRPPPVGLSGSWSPSASPGRSACATAGFQ